MRKLGYPTAFANYLLDAAWSVMGLYVLIFGTAGVVFIVAIIEYGISFRDASISAGCAGILSPVIAITAIRVVDLVLRIAFLATVVVLVIGLMWLVGKMFFGR